MKRLSSLHVRLVATYALLAFLLLGITALVFSAAFVDYARRVQQQQIRERFAQARLVAESSTLSPEQTLRHLSRLFPEFEVALYPAAPGDVLRLITPTDIGQPPPAANLMIFRTPASQTEPPGAMLVSGGTPTARYLLVPKPVPNATLRTLLPQIGLLVVAGMGLAALIGWWFARWLARPLSRLTDATAAVAVGAFPKPLDRTGTPELDRLVEQFNVMVTRLNESFRSLAAERDVARQFAADAAHELKTPLTALRAYHEIAASRPERATQLLPATGAQIERLERITNGLIKMARLSEGAEVTLTPCDLREPVGALIPGFCSLAADHDHTFTFSDAKEALPVRCDPLLLEHALANLVENACKFTAPGGQIRLCVSAEAGYAVIGVEDNGPGIPPEELPHIFQRFHRGVNTQEIPGNGLGLSIVKEAVNRLGGSVTVRSAVGKGSRFTIHLPLTA